MDITQVRWKTITAKLATVYEINLPKTTAFTCGLMTLC